LWGDLQSTVDHDYGLTVDRPPSNQSFFVSKIFFPLLITRRGTGEPLIYAGECAGTLSLWDVKFSIYDKDLKSRRDVISAEKQEDQNQVP
jgi:hypothetical protein